MTWTARVRSRERAPWLQVVKTAIAITISWLLSIALLRTDIPIFAAIAALLVVAPSVNQSLGKGVERSVGVVLGVLLAWLAGLVVGTSTWTVLGIVLVAIGVCWLLRLAPMASNQVPISAMLMLALGGAADPSLGIDRMAETVIGSAVALAVNYLIVPPAGHTAAEQAMRELAESVASSYEALAEALRTGPDASLLASARGLREQLVSVVTTMREVEDTLVMNPRSARLRPRIERDEQLLTTLRILVNRVIGMSRTVVEGWDDSLATDPVIDEVRTELSRIAHDTRLLVAMHRHEDADTRSLPTLTDPQLTEPIRVPKAHPTHWVLVGALLEDVRQTRESLSEAFGS